MRVYRTLPTGWEEVAEHLPGTGVLGWLAWTTQQMTTYAAEFGRDADWPRYRYDWIEACLRLADSLIGRGVASDLLFDGPT